MADSRRYNNSYGDRDFRERSSKSDDPPNSRLFIIGHKQLTEDDFRNAFSKFGSIEEIWVVKDKRSGENKGVTYIKYSKTSEAANALEAMNGVVLGDTDRHIKVVIAASRDQGSKRELNEDEKAQRLFVLIPKTMNVGELKDYFKQFGDIDYANIIKDKETNGSKGYAYIKYFKFSHAAEAFEKCDRKYKAVFAEPRKTTNMSNSRGGMNMNMNMSSYDRHNSHNNNSSDFGSYSARNHRDNISMAANYSQRENKTTIDCGGTKLRVISSATVTEDQLWKLFDVIPGMDYCQLRLDERNGRGVATVVYNSHDKAAYACDKLHGFEYPPGFRLIVKMDDSYEPGGGGGGVRHSTNTSGGEPPNLRHLAETLAQATSIIKSASFPGCSSSSSNKIDDMCSVSLPDPKPLADIDAQLGARCFIVCTPPPPPLPVLKDIFCRFGNLIEVYILFNRNCGYARYATKESAENAIRTLHGAEICGGRIKVMEAEDDPSRKRQKLEY